MTKEKDNMEFKIGDKVWCTFRNDFGIVREKHMTSELNCVVQFPNDDIYYCTSDGKRNLSDESSDFFHEMVDHVTFARPTEKSKRELRALYQKEQKASGIKVGDWVKVLSNTEKGMLGWEAVWDEKMNEAIGKTFEVFKVGKYGFQLSVNHISWSFPYFVLEKKIKSVLSPSIRAGQG